jgi:hypothetical protein
MEPGERTNEHANVDAHLIAGALRVLPIKVAVAARVRANLYKLCVKLVPRRREP